MGTLKGILDKYGVTAAELSRRADITPSTISTFSRGAAKLGNMRMETFLQLARGLGVSPNALILEMFGDEFDAGGTDDRRDAEYRLISDYRFMNDAARTALERVAHSMTFDPDNFDSGSSRGENEGNRPDMEGE